MSIDHNWDNRSGNIRRSKTQTHEALAKRSYVGPTLRFGLPSSIHFRASFKPSNSASRSVETPGWTPAVCSSVAALRSKLPLRAAPNDRNRKAAKLMQRYYDACMSLPRFYSEFIVKARTPFSLIEESGQRNSWMAKPVITPRYGTIEQRGIWMPNGW